jgi:GTP-binding protein HflX
MVDIAHKNAANQVLTVEKILSELNLEKKPRITVFNKLDLALGSEAELKELTAIPHFERQVALPSDSVALISAVKGWGIDDLLDKITIRLWGRDQERHAQ